ncbi:MAG: hypothetical protein AB1777_00205 [Bacteroidota bacterium]
MKKINKLLISVFLVIIALGNIGIYSNYSHVHRVNGRWVVHSHPYDTKSDKQPVKSHKHSLSEIVLLDQAKYFKESLPSQVFQLEITDTENIEKSTCYHPEVVLLLRPNRAPPLV